MQTGTQAVAAALILSLVAACGEKDSERAEYAAPWSTAPADTQWVNIEGVEFPAELADAPQDVIEAYVFAAKHQDVLSYMPCYCGCEHPRTQHANNYDCFIDAIDRSGPVPRVSPDPMGFIWTICLNVAREAKRQYEEGVPLAEIRTIIEEKYSEGKPGTPTPRPPGSTEPTVGLR